MKIGGCSRFTLFVNDDAASGGDGLGWGTAHDDLQAALTQAATFNTDGDTANDVEAIWIAEGTYTPSTEHEPGDARSANFSLVDSVALYGGFVGNEATLAERDLSSAYITILSGDLGVIGDTTDNAYTVVYCGENIASTIDGLSITGGNADGNYDFNHLERSYGGGIYNNKGTLSLNDIALTNNSVNSAGCNSGGGGIDNHWGTMTLANCKIADNSARSEGGGIRNAGGILALTGCTITGNSSQSGGGIYGAYAVPSTLTINNSVITNNTASYGGGIYGDGNLTVTNSTFMSNSASVGGGIYTYAPGTPAFLNNSILWKNNGGDLGRDWRHCWFTKLDRD